MARLFAVIMILVAGCASFHQSNGPLNKPDPLIGTWKMNVAKSNYWALQQTIVKELTASYRDLGNGQIEVTVIGTREDGSPISFKGTFPRQGGGTITGDGMSYVVSVIDPYRFYLTILQDGKQVLLYESKISKDGKTKRDRYKGINTSGEFYEGIEVSERLY